MTIKTVNIPIAPKSKPRGQIGKYGNMTHGMGGYIEWQQQFYYHLTTTSFKIVGNPYAIVYLFQMVKRGGQPPDLDNMIGAVNDVLVKYEYLADDNWKILSRQFAYAIPASKSGVSIITCDTKQELFYILDMFLK